MKTPIQLLLLFVVGLAGGLLGASLFGGGTGNAALADGLDRGEVSTASLLRALESRVMLLEREAEANNLAVSELDARVQAATRHEVPAASAAAVASGEGAAPGALDLASTPTGPGFDAAVEAAIVRREEAQRQEREAERAQRRDERVQRTVDDLAVELGLDAGQKNSLFAAMKEASTARENFFMAMRDSGNFDREAARKTITEIRDAELAKASAVLNAQQLQRYTEVSDAGRDFGRGGPGGGGQGGRNQGGRNGG